MTIIELFVLLQTSRRNMEELAVIWNFQLAKTLNNLPIKKLFVNNTITFRDITDETGYHHQCIGESPLGTDCGECAAFTCRSCPVWQREKELCDFLGIKYPKGEEIDDKVDPYRME